MEWLDRRECGLGYFGDVMREEIEKSGWGMGLLYIRTMDSWAPLNHTTLRNNLDVHYCVLDFEQSSLA